MISNKSVLSPKLVFKIILFQFKSKIVFWFSKEHILVFALLHRVARVYKPVVLGESSSKNDLSGLKILILNFIAKNFELGETSSEHVSLKHAGICPTPPPRIR